MTMITGSRLKEGGFLTADILLTSPKGTWMPPSQIPSFQTTADTPDLEAHTVVGLCQKILVVNEHFAVAFAGSVPDIQDAIRLIDKLKAQAPNLTGKRFMEALLADDRLKTADLKAIALSVENDEIQITNYCAEYGISNEHFELHVGGSGLEHAVQHYEQFALQEFDVPVEDIVVQGTCMALDQFARHLTGEFEKKFQSETIADLFGGGFEVVAYHSGQFHKIPDVVYAYAEAELDADGILQIDDPKFLLKSTYQGEDLIIRSVEIHYDEEEEGYTTRNDRTFTIAPITRYRETYVQDDCEGVNFLGEFLCYLVKVKKPSGSFTIPFIRKYDGHFGFAANAFLATAHRDNVQFMYMGNFEKELEVHVLDWMRQINSVND
ncbi:hypothetical protein [Pseudomonas veronii]|uniref:hypothetical protein n=1 Tax=Pseudomonas veronii TaxID=76761 RepID=UPI0021C1B4CA|nr:hypothetical protein [Pseudomonas veronii]MCT9826004.1 hypothetical protein [Pseudomonas veronii]